MIEGIKQLGTILLEGDETRFLNLLTQKIKTEIDGVRQHLVILDFYPESGNLNFDLEEIKGENDYTAREFLWIGNNPGNLNQIYLTTNNLGYLLSQSMPNIIEELDEDSSLRKQLQKVVGRFFFDFGIKSGSDKRYGYALDINRLGIDSELDLQEVKDKIKQGDKNPKDVPGLVSKSVQKYLSQKKSVSDNQISLYTVAIEGEVLVKSEEYRRLILSRKLPDFSERGKARCFLCNEQTPLTDDVTRLKFKYYMKDKMSFSSGFTGNFAKSFSFCSSCYIKIAIGENFVANNMRTEIGHFRRDFGVYIIPEFLFPSEMSSKKLQEFSNYVKFYFNSVKNFEGIKFYEELEEYRDYEEQKNNFVVNLLFYESPKGNREFKILKLIKDVPPSRFEILIKTTNHVTDVAANVFGHSKNWNIDLQKIYFLTPIRVSKGNPVEFHRLLELYDAIFSGKPIQYRMLIKQILELFRVYRFEKFKQYNISPTNDSDSDMRRAAIQANLFLLFLKHLNLLRGGNMDGINLENLPLSEAMKDFITEMGYNEAQTALFLLGRMIGEVGWKQAGTSESKKKPILDKISYQGMDVKRIIRLTNEVFEKLKQYNILRYNEKLFTACKNLLDKNLNPWPLDNQENVFYILSGYSYFEKREESKDDEQE